MSEGSYEEGFEPKKVEDKKESTEIKNEENASDDFSEESLPSDYADALKKDKKEGEEELKELSSDYKVGYDQYLKEKDNPKKEDDERDELIRDYRSGLDLGNKESAPSAPKRTETIKEEPIEAKEKEEIEPKQEVAKEEVKATPEEVKEEKAESKEETAEKEPVEQSGKEVKEQLGEALKSPEKTEKKDEVKDNSVEIGMLTNELIELFQEKNKLLSKKNAQQGLAYRLGIRKKDSKINDEYGTVYDKYEKVLERLAEFKKCSKEEAENIALAGIEGGERQEKSPESESRLEGIKDYLFKETKKVNEQIKNLEGGKKGSFEKIKALMKDRKFQFVVGLAIVGIAIAAPPTGFISMVTFGMHAGFLPAAYATKATALAGMAGGAFIMRGFSGFVNDLKKEGKEEIDLTSDIK